MADTTAYHARQVARDDTALERTGAAGDQDG
jgi:hypothetical protein